MTNLVHPGDVREKAEALGYRMRLIEQLQLGKRGGYEILFVIESEDVIVPSVGPMICRYFEMSLEGLQQAMQWLEEQA